MYFHRSHQSLRTTTSLANGICSRLYGAQTNFWNILGCAPLITHTHNLFLQPSIRIFLTFCFVLFFFCLKIGLSNLIFGCYCHLSFMLNLPIDETFWTTDDSLGRYGKAVLTVSVLEVAIKALEVTSLFFSEAILLFW